MPCTTTTTPRGAVPLFHANVLRHTPSAAFISSTALIGSTRFGARQAAVAQPALPATATATSTAAVTTRIERFMVGTSRQRGCAATEQAKNQRAPERFRRHAVRGAARKLQVDATGVARAATVAPVPVVGHATARRQGRDPRAVGWVSILKYPANTMRTLLTLGTMTLV